MFLFFSKRLGAVLQLVLVRHVLMLIDRSVVPLRMVFGSYQVVFLKTMLVTVLEKLDQEIQVLPVTLMVDHLVVVEIHVLHVHHV